MLGPIINALAIFLGGTIGSFLGKITKFEKNESLIQLMGIFTVFLGLQTAWRANSGSRIMILLCCLVIGLVIGEILKLEDRLHQFIKAAEKRIRGKALNETPFVNAFITSTVLFTVGPMAILGSIQAGLANDPSVLITKSIIDVVMATLLSTTQGIGIAFSSLVVLIYEGALTLFAAQAKSVATPMVIDSISAAGGIMLACVGSNLAGFTKIRVLNATPALILIAIFTYFNGSW